MEKGLMQLYGCYVSELSGYFCNSGSPYRGSYKEEGYGMPLDDIATHVHKIDDAG